MNYPVVEKFVSINGEGARAGELAAFIRLKGCNLRCPYCDTKWAYREDAPFEMMSEDELCAFAKGVKNVTITGGEPMLHALSPLVKALILCGHLVEIETNGSVPIDALSKLPARPFFTLDYKSPSSGMEGKMVLENYKYLSHGDCVKFVVGNRNDLERAEQIIKQYSLTQRCYVYLSAVFGEITPAEIVEYMIERGLNSVRVQLQMHKFIWDPERRGV